MSPWSLALLLATCMTSATADVFFDVDWVTAENANKSIPITGPAESSHHISKRRTRYESPYGIIRHWSSKKYIHLEQDARCPSDGTELVIKTGKTNDKRMYFRFIQVTGHYGYLKHHCGKIIHPEMGLLNPKDSSKLQIASSRHAGALFTIDQAETAIIHRSGKRFHPYGGGPDPPENDRVVLHHHKHDAARFEFLNPHTDQVMPPFPKPTLSGYWKVLYAVINPLAHHEYHITYKVGKSISKQASTQHAWKVGLGVSLKWFQASGEYNGFAQKSETSTWDEAKTRTMNIKVSPGKTVVTWQYFFEAEQFGDGLQFRSTILADTDDVNKQPNITQTQFNP